MKVRKAYKFELRPDGEQRRSLARFAGCCRWLWNSQMALREDTILSAQSVGAKPDWNHMNYVATTAELARWKRYDVPWLKEAPSQMLQQTLKDFETAWNRCYKGLAKRPRFKKKGQPVGLRFPQGFRLEEGNRRVMLPKLGWMRYRKSRDIEGTLKNITLRQECGRWYMSVQTEMEVEEPIHPCPEKSTGIDRGITHFAALADGTMIDGPNAMKSSSKQRARLQRQLARKKKFSKNWHEQKQRISKLHTRIARVRADHLHKTSRIICNNHAIVVIEDLKVINMSASAKGDTDQHGKNVKAKSGLNRSILDQGWSEFARQLDYKLTWNGGSLVEVPAHHTSQRCSCCGHVEAENRNGKKFLCLSCGHVDDADVNAAKNIMADGLSVAACRGYRFSGPSKQEPAEGATLTA